MRFAARVNIAEATAGVDARVGSTCMAVEVLDICCGAVTGAWAAAAGAVTGTWTAAAGAEGGIEAPTEEAGRGGTVGTGVEGITVTPPP